MISFSNGKYCRFLQSTIGNWDPNPGFEPCGPVMFEFRNNLFGKHYFHHFEISIFNK